MNNIGKFWNVIEPAVTVSEMSWLYPGEKNLQTFIIIIVVYMI